MNDYYLVLGIGRDSSIVEIRDAYRRKSKEHHPDMGGDSKKFMLIREAYDVLGKEESRRNYDKWGCRDLDKWRNDLRLFLSSEFIGILLNCPDLNRHDPVSALKSYMIKQGKLFRKGIDPMRDELGKLELSLVRLRGDLLLDIVRERILEVEKGIRHHELMGKFYDWCLEYVEDYGYDLGGDIELNVGRLLGSRDFTFI